MGDVYLDKSMRGWIVNTAKAELWRCPKWYSQSDLEQDGYLAYTKCWNRYRELFDVPNPTKGQRKHFMALVQRTFYNHIMTLAGKTKDCTEACVSQLTANNESEAVILDRISPAMAEAGSLMAALATLPEELADALKRVLTDGVDTGAYSFSGHRRMPNSRRTRRSPGQAKIRETTEEYWTRILGVPNVPERLSEYLKS